MSAFPPAHYPIRPYWSPASNRPLSASPAKKFNLLQLILALYVFFLPVQFIFGQIETSQINIAASDIFLFLAMLLGYSHFRLRRAAWSIFHPALVLIFFYGAAITAVVTGHLTTYAVVKVAGLLLLFAGYFALTSAATSWAAIRSLLRIFVIAVTLNAAVAVCAFIAHFSPLWLNYGSERVSGMLLDPNAFGGLLMVALVLQGVTQQGGQPLIEGVPGWIASVILAVGLILTLSRSAWMGLGLAVVVIALARPKRVVLWGALALLAVGAVYLILGQESGSRELALAQRENTAMQRVDQVRQGWAMFSEHPILGAGLGAFDRDKDPGTPHATLIHNTSIWMLSEFGLMGLTVFAGFMLWFILRGREALRLADPAAQPLILALISAHVGMLGVSAGIEALYQRHWWLVMAMLASSWVLARNNKRRFLVFRGGRR